MTVHGKPWRFSVDQYAKMGDAGVFDRQRVELIEGQIVPMSPQNPPHASRIAKITSFLVYAFGQTHEVRVQLPLTLNSRSEPEPDFALVSFEVANASPRHPTTADLIIEIADSSLPFDRSEKASLYSKSSIQEYWILNLKDDRLENRRGPVVNDDATYGWDYASLTLLAPGSTLSPLFAPATTFEVSLLLGLD